MPGPDAFRLPRTVEPVRYELTITPDVQSSTFSGEERIRLRVAEPGDRIVLNAAELAVTAAELVPAAGGPGTGQRVLLAHDDAAERVTLSPIEPLGPGTWDLLLRFDGRLNDKLRGFYRSTFRDQEGNEQVIAATQFEPADARRAFPCWDEPDRKAVFSVALVVDPGLTAVSNGRVVAEEVRPDGRRRITFEDTMPMSTYLVAFVVGALSATAATDVDGVPVRVVHVAGKEHLTGFAREVAAHALRFFTR